MPKEKSKIIDTIKKVMPAVVSIMVMKSFEALKHEMPEILDPKNVDPRILKEKIDAHGNVQVGGGSGFVVDSTGIILTNKHVVSEDGGSYVVITSVGEEYPAEILARDPIDDVAILKIAAKKKLPAVLLGESGDVELGEIVLAIGNALGIFKNTVSQGIVSGLSRAVSAQKEANAPPQEMRGLIQTDAAINPGNSGGPLVNIFGEAIGINAAVVYGAQNINFAIPIDAAKRDLNDLKKFGRIRRPLLGLRYLTINKDLKEKMALPVDYGALISKEHAFREAIVPESPAHKAGLREKDIILEWNGEKITFEKTIQDYLEKSAPGDEVALSLLRGGKHESCKVILAERK